MRSRTLTLLRALAVRFLMFILCRAAKNEPRKRAQAFPLGTPWHCRAARIKTRFDSAPSGRASNFVNTHGRQRKQKNVAFRFAQNLCRQGCVAHSKKIYISACVHLPCLQVSLTCKRKVCICSPSQKHWRRQRRQFLRALGVLRGAPLNPLSWFVLSRTRKNEHKNPHRSARAESAQYDRQKEQS